MRYLTGTLLLTIGFVLIAARSRLGAAVTRANRTATGRNGRGWEAFDRFVFVSVGLFAVTFGLANLFGFID